MAKAHFRCAECGASMTVLGRNRSDADSRAKWHEKNGAVCNDCEDKKRAAESQSNAEANRTAGLPALNGSKKQIAWAETLRATLLQRLEYTQTALSFRERALATSGEARTQLFAERDTWQSTLPAPWNTSTTLHYGAVECTHAGVEAWMLVKLADCIRAQASASWWIEHRSSTVVALIESMAGQIAAMDMAAPETDGVAADAMAEALLKPVVEPESQMIVEISSIQDELRIAYPEKREDFRQAMHALGYAWDKKHWSRRLSAFTGSAEDRMAEAALRVLALRLMVRVHDEAARAKALSGDIVPEQRRWVSRIASGEFAGWLSIRWGRDDDFYDAARSLPGSRYKAGAVYVPAGAVVAVADFAAHHGFSLSTAAQSLLGEHHAALAGGAVVTTCYQIPEPVRVACTGVPPKLVAEPGDIDEALRDD